MAAPAPPPPTLSLPTSSSSSSVSSASPRPASMRRLGSNSSSVGSEPGHAHLPTHPLVPVPSRKSTLALYPPDRFVIVRPPASKQNHPLNLQIQLVVPVPPPSLPSPNAVPPPTTAAPTTPAQRRDPSFGSMASAFSSDPNLRRRSIALDGLSPNSPREGSLHAVAHATLSSSSATATESTPTTTGGGGNQGGAPLRRTSSARSTGSVATTMSGWSGVSDAASSLATRSDAGAAASAGRKVTPLYNLQWHTVLPTYISDAGTDAKIAKFAKRGIEVADLANIEPGEIRHGVDVFSPTSRDSAKGLSRTSSRPPTDLSTSISSTSLNGGPSPPGGQQQDEKGPVAFFNKFKKLGIKAKFGQQQQQQQQPSVGGEAGSGRDATTDHHPDLPSTNAALSMVGPALGSGRRAEGYVWQVRKWARPDLDAFARANGGGTSVSLEWRKTKKQRPPTTTTILGNNANRRVSPPGMIATGEAGKKPAGGAEGRPSMDAARTGEGTTADPNRLVSRRDRHSFNSEASAVRPALGSRASSPRAISDDGEEEDEEEDSDPEDSERVWTCELVLPSTSSSTSGGQSSTTNNGFLGAGTTARSSTGRRILVGTVRPNPHHPRVIAHFAVPGTLTTVTLGNPREGGPTAELKASEIKDLVAITCLWLCVKERLGGLGGEGRRRKGDGSWRLRM